MTFPQQPISIPDVIGHIPATEKTPDLYYCGDASSEKVAALTFLTLWFLDSPIQKIVKERVGAVICGLSPISGGKKLETAFSDATESATFLTAGVIKYDFGFFSNQYTGTCRYPLWDGDRLVRKGHIAIYATSIYDDEKNGYTQRWNDRARAPLSDGKVAEEDHEYRSIYHRPPHKFGVHRVLEAFELPADERDAFLAEILKSEFSDIDSLFDMVPKRVAHEVAHILEHGHNLVPNDDMVHEINANVSHKNHMVSYYRRPLEAVAELAGIALLNQVKQNAGLDFGMPTTMLDKFVPNAFFDIDQKIAQISEEPSPE